MNSKASILWSISVIILFEDSLQTHCPEYDVLKPCYCHSRTAGAQHCGHNGSDNSYNCQIPVISCAGDQAFNLSDVFLKVSKTIDKDNDRPFEWLYLSNSAITRLEDKTFWGIKFKRIYIRHSSSLQTISPMAFEDSSQFVNNIWINATILSDKKVNKRNTFTAINSLTNLKTLEVMSSRFTSIPSMAFKKYSSIRTISFHNYNERQLLKRINTKAFYKLSDLKRIDLSNNRISRINSFAFSFETESNHTLRIHLENNYLKSDSFSPKAFMGANGRRVILYLGAFNQCNPDLKYLDKEVFEPFLAENKRNAIELYGCPIECDHNALWMERPRSLLKRRIRHVKCVPNIVLSKAFKKSDHQRSDDKKEERMATNQVKKLTKRRPKVKTRPNKKVRSTTEKPRMTLKRRLGYEYR